MIRRFFRINTWALFLDILAICGISFLLTGMHNLFIFFPVLLAVLCLAFNGIRLHSHYPERLKVLEILLRKNKAELREDTFREFMYAPCGRMLVLEALDTLGYKNRYSEIARRYPLFSRKLLRERNSLVIVPYNDLKGETK